MYSWIALTEELLYTLVEDMQYCMLFEQHVLPHFLKDGIIYLIILQVLC